MNLTEPPGWRWTFDGDTSAKPLEGAEPKQVAHPDDPAPWTVPTVNGRVQWPRMWCWQHGRWESWQLHKQGHSKLVGLSWEWSPEHSGTSAAPLLL